jgi:hypothetical protein
MMSVFTPSTSTEGSDAAQTQQNADLQAGLTNLAQAQGTNSSTVGTVAPPKQSKTTQLPDYGDSNWENASPIHPDSTTTSASNPFPTLGVGHGVGIHYTPSSPSLYGTTTPTWVPSTATSTFLAEQAAAASTAALAASNNAMMISAISTAAIMPVANQALAALQNQNLSNQAQDLHGGGAYGARDQAAGTTGLGLVQAANATLGKQQDAAVQVQNETNTLDNLMTQEIAQHGTDAQGAMQGVQTTIDSLTNELGNLQGQDQLNLQTKIDDLRNSLTALQNQYGADKQADSNFWTQFGAIATIVAGVATVVVSAVGTPFTAGGSLAGVIGGVGMITGGVTAEAKATS